MAPGKKNNRDNFPSTEDDNKDDFSEATSKTQVKKEMHRLQALGEELIALSNTEIEALPLSDKLKNALLETRNIRKKEALRRHKQYIGKLMRSEQIEPIEAALEEKRLRHKTIVDSHHKIEAWRDRILEGQEGVDEFIASYPDADRQWLQTMSRKSKSEQQSGRPPSAARKIFGYIRDTLSQAR